MKHFEYSILSQIEDVKLYMVRDIYIDINPLIKATNNELHNKIAVSPSRDEVEKQRFHYEHFQMK